MAVISTFSSNLIHTYEILISELPQFAKDFIGLFLLVLLIILYAVFTWKFHKFIAAKNIFNFNLNKYNKSTHPFWAKFFAAIFYFVEYLIVLPFIIFFWFSVLTIFLILFTESLEVQTILVISVVVISAIRMLAYYKGRLAEDLAKLLPLNFLAFSLLNPGFFNFERILSNVGQIPEFFGKIAFYLIFIVVIEAILRFFAFVFSFVEKKAAEEALNPES